MRAMYRGMSQKNTALPERTVGLQVARGFVFAAALALATSGGVAQAATSGAPARIAIPMPAPHSMPAWSPIASPDPADHTPTPVAAPQTAPLSSSAKIRRTAVLCGADR